MAAENRWKDHATEWTDGDLKIEVRKARDEPPGWLQAPKDSYLSSNVYIVSRDDIQDDASPDAGPVLLLLLASSSDLIGRASPANK